MTRAAEVIIDRDALRHNFEQARQAAPAARILAVIKDNGYGHGMISAARALAGADGYGVACLEEALALRAAEVRKPVVLLAGFFGREELPQIAEYDITVVLHHALQLQMLEAARLPAPVAAWVKIDTGMHRLGFRPEQVPAVLERVRGLDQVRDEVVLMTHLASADERADDTTRRQLDCFATANHELALPASIANSAAVLGWPQSHGDWVRPGLMLYGLSPFPDTLGSDHGLRPVMTLQSRLIAINDMRRGDCIGYGGSWCCPEDMPVGVIAIGYGDGYPRSAASGTPVLIHGQEAPLVGRVSMDMLSVDLRGLPQARVGDEVTLWGEGLPVERIARAAGRIPYELTCGVAARVRRNEVGA